MAHWLESSVGDRGVVCSIPIFSNLFSMKYSTIFSVFAKNLRVVSSDPGQEDFLLYALFSAFEC